MVLKGIKVLELAGLAPSPLCGMILADFGANVIRVDKTGSQMNYDVTCRGKRSISIDLKQPEGAQVLRQLSQRADVLIEPFRCGVMEKLDLGPEVLMADNPRLIYARLTGYGGHGAYSNKAGHDINYLSLSGILSKLGRHPDPPVAPINLLADFAGGSFICALGIMAALVERSNTGKGQLVDSNMVEGAAYVGSWIFKSQEMMVWGKARGNNLLDGGAHFYDTYETKDGKYMAVGSLEPQFYRDLIKGLGFSAEDMPHFGNFAELKPKIRDRFLQKTRDEWTQIFDQLDACVTPVLEMEEAPFHPHNQDRGSFAKNVKGKFDPIPAPRLSNLNDKAHEIVARPEPQVGQHSVQVLEEAGFTGDQIAELVSLGVVECAEGKAKL